MYFSRRVHQQNFKQHRGRHREPFFAPLWSFKGGENWQREIFPSDDEVHDTNLCNCLPLRFSASDSTATAARWILRDTRLETLSLPSGWLFRRLCGKQKSLIILYCTWFAVHSVLIAFWQALLVKRVHKNAIYRLINHRVIVAVYKCLGVIKIHSARRIHSHVGSTCWVNESGTCEFAFPPNSSTSMSPAFMNNRRSRKEFH